MPRCSIKHLFTALLILAVATLATFGNAGQANAATSSVVLDRTYLYLNVAPGSTAEATFTVTAAADQPLFPSVNAGWLSLDQTRWQGSRTVRITATAQGMAPGDMRVARIEFPGATLPVVLAVGGPGTPPSMVVTPTSVDFGTLALGQSSTYYLNLALAAPADIRVTADADWIDVRPLSMKAASTTVISVRPVLTKVTTARQYTGTIEVQAGSLAPVRIPVTLRVAGPEPSQAEPAALQSAGPFTDVPAGHWAQDAIAELAASRVITGLGDGRFDPDGTVTREQFAKLLVLALGLSTAPQPAKAPYPDVAADRWSAPYIGAAQPYMARYYDGLFHPEIPAMREEMAVALARARGLAPAAATDLYNWFSDYAEIAPSARPWVATARAFGLIGGFPDRTFRPADPITRAQVAILLQRARTVCGNPPQPGCAAPLGAADQSLAGATPRGVKIGDSVEAVRKAYGPQGELEGGVLTYRTGADFEYFYLQFFIVDGKVNAILLSQSK